MKCETCHYWQLTTTIAVDVNEVNLIGHCRRFPPRVHGVGFTAWPSTNSDAWCGEYKPKEQPECQD